MKGRNDPIRDLLSVEKETRACTTKFRYGFIIGRECNQIKCKNDPVRDLLSVEKKLGTCPTKSRQGFTIGRK
jgi:hypothetical protein